MVLGLMDEEEAECQYLFEPWDPSLSTGKVQEVYFSNGVDIASQEEELVQGVPL